MPIPYFNLDVSFMSSTRVDLTYWSNTVTAGHHSSTNDAVFSTKVQASFYILTSDKSQYCVWT